MSSNFCHILRFYAIIITVLGASLIGCKDRPTTPANLFDDTDYRGTRCDKTEGVTGSYDLLRLQKDLVRYEATASNPAGHFSWGMTELDGYNGADAAPKGTLKSNAYRFLCQIPQLELTTNEAVSESDQNPFKGQ